VTRMHLVPERLDDFQADMTEAKAGESGCIVIANKPALLRDGCSRHRGGFATVEPIIERHRSHTWAQAEKEPLPTSRREK
jgi:hypothetical protein